MSGTYAADTAVTSGKSREEIERTLVRFGASAFSYGWQGDAAMIAFVAGGRQIRFILPMPQRDSREFTLTETGRTRSASAATEAWEKAGRQRWRALALMVKAKLAAVEAGIVTFEEEFMAHTVLPSGRTVSQEIGPQVEAAYVEGRVARLEIEQ